MPLVQLVAVIGLLHVLAFVQGTTTATKPWTLEDFCLKPMDEGKPCKQDASRVQYYFNTETEECAPFLFKGCGGNSNRYTFVDHCTDACQVEYFKRKNKKNQLEEPPSRMTKADCALAPDSGPCKALIPQWHFDSKNKKCVTFNYGGCKGNKNRFNTEATCMNVCSNK